VLGRWLPHPPTPTGVSSASAEERSPLSPALSPDFGGKGGEYLLAPLSPGNGGKGFGDRGLAVAARCAANAHPPSPSPSRRAGVRFIGRSRVERGWALGSEPLVPLRDGEGLQGEVLPPRKDDGTTRMGQNRVNRGGSWNNHARNCRAAYRNANAPDNRNHNLGFRLAREHEQVGGPALDPSRTVSGGLRAGETQTGLGVEVAAADAPSNPRRTPTFSGGCTP
jgi:hypothetical protein